jgi:HAD superfamily hydrolase (TIGR01509 family)
MAIRAVLFDFDGVIADTENVHVAAWQRTLGTLGWDEPEESCARAVELDDRVFLAEIFARRNVKAGDVDGWVLRKQRLARQLLADARRIYPGLEMLVRQVSTVVTLGIVTTTWRENVRAVLDTSGLTDAFPVIVAKEDVKKPKPFPEGYKLALSRLDLKASEVVAIEDSPGGLAAAKGAGIRAVAVGHRRASGEWVGDSRFVADLTDLAAVREALGI